MSKNKSLGMLKQGMVVPEYLAKAAAVPAAILTAGSEGGLVSKVGAGFHKLINFPLEVYNNATYLGEMNSDADSLTARQFGEKYGTEVINTSLEYGHEALNYVDQFAANVAEQPVTTTLATAISLAAPLILARTMRFIRQEGKGSLLDRTERSLGEKIWRK